MEIPEIRRFEIEQPSVPSLAERLVGPSPWKDGPDRDLLERHARIAYEQKFFPLLKQFLEFDPQEAAFACECFQANMRDLFKGTHGVDKLNFFRLNQRIRNEHGSPCRHCPSNCLCSYEDLIELEQEIKSNDIVVFMVQCMKLKLVDGWWVLHRYDNIRSLSQLERFYDAVIRFDCETFICEPAFERYFYCLARESLKKKGLAPTWSLLKLYLKRVHNVYWETRGLFGENIASEDLDQALNMILNHRQRSDHPWYDDDSAPHGKRAVVLQLLERGARLYYRHPEENNSSIVEFVSRTQRVFCDEDFSSSSEVSKYICCPLRSESSVVRFDDHRVAPLTCLAARSMDLSRDCPIEKLPPRFRGLIEVHHELELHLSQS